MSMQAQGVGQGRSPAGNEVGAVQVKGKLRGCSAARESSDRLSPDRPLLGGPVPPAPWGSLGQVGQDSAM